MSFKLGRRSQRELKGVQPKLDAVVRAAIRITPVDFAVHDGVRSDAEQLALYRAGASKIDGITRRGKHQIQPDGFGHAVDLVPYINGKLRWEWPPIYLIADAVREAAEVQGTRILWGGTWSELTGTDADIEDQVEAYVARRKAMGRSAFIDGPHFELIL